MTRPTIHPLSAHIGARIRVQRIAHHLSQIQLAKKIGMTAAALWAYETGRSIPSVRRLWKFSEVLKVPVGFFFEGYRTDKRARKDPEPEPVTEMFATADGLLLARAFGDLKTPKTRSAVVALVRELAKAA